MKKIRKTKQLGFCLLSAMSLCQINGALYAKEERFLINGEMIQHQYHEQASLSFQVKDEEKEKVILYVKDREMNQQRIEDIHWQKQDSYWIGSVDVMDGDDLQYELWIDDNSYQTPAFSKDTINCSMKIFEDGVETGMLQDGYTKETTIQLQFFDKHMEHVEALIVQNDEMISPNWIKENELLELKLEEGQYDLFITTKDSFGNTEVYEKHILVDKILPAISIMADGKEVQEQIYEKDQLLDIVVEEEHLDLARSTISLDGNLIPISWEMEGNRHYSTCLISKEGTHELTLRMYDTAGNYLEKNVKIDIDITPPGLTWMEQNEPITEWKEIYDHPLHLQMKIEEPHLNLDHSYVILDGVMQPLTQRMDVYEFVFEDGRHEFEYHIEDDLGHVTEGTLDSFLVDGTAPAIDVNVSAFHRTSIELPIKVNERNLNDLQVTLIHNNIKKEGLVSWSKQNDTYTGSMKFEEEGNYELEISAVDIAGNRTTKKLSFTIDKTAPKVDTKCKDQDSGMYIDHARTFELTAADQYLNPKQSIVEVYQNGNLINRMQLSESRGTYRADVRTDEDGTYEIKWQIEDMAGNQTNGSSRYIIDQTAPILNVRQLTASISNTFPSFFYQVMDDNLKEYELQITRDHQSESYRYHSNKEETLTLPAYGYGSFDVFLRATDLAGHTVVSDPLHFIYDPDLPVIQTTINGTNAKESVVFVTNKDVSLSAMMQDAHLGQSRFTLYQDGKKVYVSQDPSIDLTVKKQSGEVHTYEFIAEASDLAGNMLQKVFSFMIDCEKPKLLFDNDVKQGQIFQESWTPSLSGSQKEYQIISYTLQRNGQMIPYEWNQPIEEEGTYELRLQIRDQAMNRWELTPFQFSIDQSAPIIRLYDVTNTWFIEDRIPQNAKLCIYLDQEDRVKREKETFTKIIINGKQINLDEIRRDEHGYPYYLLEVTEPLHIYVEAVDEAGNVQIIEKDIQPVEKKVVEKEIKVHQKTKEPEDLMLSEKEELGDEVMWIVVWVMFIGCGFLWYGIRKRRNHHS